MPNIYKTFTKTQVDNKPSYVTSAEQNTKINAAVSKFVELFKIKHLS